MSLLVTILIYLIIFIIIVAVIRYLMPILRLPAVWLNIIILILSLLFVIVVLAPLLGVTIR